MIHGTWYTVIDSLYIVHCTWCMNGSLYEVKRICWVYRRWSNESQIWNAYDIVCLHFELRVWRKILTGWPAKTDGCFFSRNNDWRSVEDTFQYNAVLYVKGNESLLRDSRLESLVKPGLREHQARKTPAQRFRTAEAGASQGVPGDRSLRHVPVVYSRSCA